MPDARTVVDPNGLSTADWTRSSGIQEWKCGYRKPFTRIAECEDIVMWRGIQQAFESLVALSPWSLVLGVLIAFISLADAIRTAKQWKESASKVIIGVLSIELLLVQAKSSKMAEAKSARNLDEALHRQRDDLASAFGQGTDQILKSSAQQASQLRRSAKDQTHAIELQASKQLLEMKETTLGSQTCPGINGGISRPRGRPSDITIFNLDPVQNMYDVVVRLTEFGPGPNGLPWSTILQTKTISVPLIRPDRATSVPVTFLSRMNMIDVQLEVSTRSKNCSGRVDLYDTGGNVWINDDDTMYGDGKVQRVGEHRSAGLAAAKPESDIPY